MASEKTVLARRRGRARLRLRKPMALTVESLGDTYAVGVGSLRIFGAGSTMQEAVNDFWHNLASVYSSYATSPPDELSRDGRQYLKRLRALIQAD